MGWEKPVDSATTWKTDCKLHKIDNYFYYLVVPVIVLDIYESINEGQMERQEALKQAAAISQINEGILELMKY